MRSSRPIESAGDGAWIGRAATKRMCWGEGGDGNWCGRVRTDDEATSSFQVRGAQRYWQWLVTVSPSRNGDPGEAVAVAGTKWRWRR